MTSKPSRYYHEILLCLVVVGLLGGWLLRGILLSNLGYIDLVEAISANTPGERLVVRYDPPKVINDTRLVRAEDRFRQAVIAWPYSASAYAGLGEVLIWRGQYDRAAENLVTAIRGGGSSRYKYQAGNAHMLAGNRARGLELWLSATEQPGLRWRLAELIFGLAQRNNNYLPERWKDAIYIMEETLKQPGLTTDMVAHFRRVLTGMYQSSGDSAAAERVIRLALGDNPGDSQTRALLAWVLMNQGRRNEALQESRLALVSRPVWMAHYVIGMVLFTQCQLEDSARELEAGLNIQYDGDYRYYGQYATLGLVRWEQGDTQGALAQLHTYLQFQPGDRSAADIFKKVQKNELVKNCPAR